MPYSPFKASRISRSQWLLTSLFLALGILSTASSPSSSDAHFQPVVLEAEVWTQNRAPRIPNQEDIAGEAVPMDAFGVQEQLDRELVVNTYHHSSTMMYLKRASRWFPVIEPILEEEGIPEDLKYLAVIESGLDQVVSPAGAAGFWQFMKGTAPEYGLFVNAEVDERYHVEKATRAACAYMRESKEEFGSWALAAASYNMGKAGVRRELKEQGVSTYWDLHLNSETARYVYRLLAIKAIFESPGSFGFELHKDALYHPYETRTLWVRERIADWAAFAQSEGSNLKALKILNPWLRRDQLTSVPGDSLAVLLPR
ncbi:MAG: lytic transglycosylase domain-containing protein [Flavobacteriales bacterium]